MSEFFSMGGYGFYVWSSFGMAALIVAMEVASLRRRYKMLIQRLSRIARVNTGVS